MIINILLLICADALPNEHDLLSHNGEYHLGTIVLFVATVIIIHKLNIASEGGSARLLYWQNGVPTRNLIGH